jgi:hypothetical protein
MLLDRHRNRPTKRGDRSECPSCHGELIAKCGEIVIWHWAHRAEIDCDPWAEPEGDWHRGWKLWLMESRGASIEVVIGEHRADAVMPNGEVVELQHSAIDPATIREREAFYKRMLWLYDAKQWWSRLEYWTEPRADYPDWWPQSWRRRDKSRQQFFSWKSPKLSMLTHQSPVWWDLVDNVRRVALEMKDGTVVGKTLLSLPRDQWVPVADPWPR